MPDVLGDAADFVFNNPIGQALLAPANLIGDVVDEIPVVGPYIVPAALALTGNPAAAAAYSGIRAGTKTGDPLSGLLAAGGTYAGNVVGSSLGQTLGETFGGTLAQTPSNALGDIFGGEAVGSLAPFGSFAGNALGSAGIANIAGGVLGSQMGGTLGQPPETYDIASAPSIPGFSANKMNTSLPASLSQFGSLSQDQQLSNIATKGVYGGGAGPEESQYFLNLINNRLIDDPGALDKFSPIDNSYLAQLGLGGYSDPTDLLKGISNYRA
jgi:hypothetical protein